MNKSKLIFLVLIFFVKENECIIIIHILCFVNKVLEYSAFDYTERA